MRWYRNEGRKQKKGCAFAKLVRGANRFSNKCQLGQTECRKCLCEHRTAMPMSHEGLIPFLLRLTPKDLRQKLASQPVRRTPRDCKWQISYANGQVLILYRAAGSMCCVFRMNKSSIVLVAICGSDTKQNSECGSGGVDSLLARAVHCEEATGLADHNENLCPYKLCSVTVTYYR